MTTGQIIKKLREERQMTQEKLADLMEYSHKSSINKIEMGKSDLPQSKLVAFAKIINGSECNLSDQEIELLNLFSNFSVMEKAKLLVFAKVFYLYTRFLHVLLNKKRTPYRMPFLFFLPYWQLLF